MKSFTLKILFHLLILSLVSSFGPLLCAENLHYSRMMNGPSDEAVRYAKGAFEEDAAADGWDLFDRIPIMNTDPHPARIGLANGSASPLPQNQSHPEDFILLVIPILIFAGIKWLRESLKVQKKDNKDINDEFYVPSDRTSDSI